MLDGLDAIVIDLQDIGARFYTYMTTMAYVMEEAAKTQAAGVRARSAQPDQRLADRRAGARQGGASSFVGYFPMPVRHGMTLGELARLFNAENKIGADLTVVPMKNWRRDDWFDETGAAVDQPVAEHAQHDRGGALSRHRRDRGDERLGRPRHRHAVRARRRAVDRRRRSSPTR